MNSVNYVFMEDEKEYQLFIDSFPDAVVIISDNKFSLANFEACELIGVNYINLIGESIYKYIPVKYKKIVHKRIKQLLENKNEKLINEYVFNCSSCDPKDIQIISKFITYKGKPSILSNIRNITEMKKEINRAAEFQRNSLQKLFPIPDKMNIESVYVPAKAISGDFYRIHKVNTDFITGVIVDVSGKGITAALSISALDVLFLEEVSITHNPTNLLTNLNDKLISLFEENYIAACCFSMDFKKKELKVVGAGINQFIFQKKGNSAENITVEGTFLGMFKNSKFDELVLPIEPGDRIFFFTDGLDFIIDEDRVIQNYLGKVSTTTFKNYINEFLSDTIVDVGNLKDDCTMLAIDIK